MTTEHPRSWVARPGDPFYPRGLLDLRTPPPSLWGRGEAWEQDQRMIAVVGTRAADDTALRAAREIAIAACQAGFAVVSGGAMGVDAAAHQGALEIGGRTVAVMAGAVDSPGPARTSRLFAPGGQQGGPRELPSEESPDRRGGGRGRGGPGQGAERLPLDRRARVTARATPACGAW
jgi:predicted Rossmann fold nucleotide-binding protein DprA/Smf involved in DNA uptake